MEISKTSILSAVILVFLVSAVIYVTPFLIGPLISPLKMFWGFYVGRRRRRPLLLAAYPATVDPNRAVKIESATPEVVELDKLIQQEFTYLDESAGRKHAALKRELDEIDGRLKNIEATYKSRREAAKENPVAKVYSRTAGEINGRTFKDAFLCLFICFILIIDTLIARHIFISMKIFTQEGVIFSLKLFNRSIPIDYPTLYGLFFTVAVALLLHMAWSRGKVKSFFAQSRWSLVAGGVALATFFVVRLVTVLNTSLAQSLIEVLILICWIIGVVAVYWLAGEIVGDEHDYLRLLVALSSPILLVLFLVFGLPVLVQMLIEWLLKGFGNMWFGLRRSRTLKRERNVEDGYHAMKKGVYRGMTL